MPTFETHGALHPEEHRDIIVPHAELPRILSYLYNGVYVALCNPRQTGKTTLLWQLRAHLLRQDYGVAYIDLSAYKDFDKTKFYQNLCDTISHEFRRGIASATQDIATFQGITDQLEFIHYLRGLAADTPQLRKLVLMFDEIGGVPEAIADTFFPALRTFFNNGRGDTLARDLYRKVVCIFTGALDLERLMQTIGPTSPFNICESVSLTDFTLHDVRSLVNKIQGAARQHLEALSGVVHAWCDGHPYLTQRLLGYIEADPACQTATSISRLEEAVQRLVEQHFVIGSDTNVGHICKHLQENQAYQNEVYEIVHNAPRNATAHDKDLRAIGVIKRAANGHLIIRNKLYRKALMAFFAPSAKGNS